MRLQPVGEQSAHEALIGLGANLSFGDLAPFQTLRAAVSALASLGSVRALSGFWRTPAWPEPNRPVYINAVARLVTALPAHETLLRLHETETIFGRTRDALWADRTCDLDLLTHGDLVDPRPNSGHPILPHPRMHERAFVLLPLRDVAPRWRDPRDGRGIDDLIAALPPEASIGAERFCVAS